MGFLLPTVGMYCSYGCNGGQGICTGKRFVLPVSKVVEVCTVAMGVMGPCMASSVN